MWNQKEGMDGGRYILHQAGWDDKSALGRYDNAHNPDFRHGGAYPGQGYPDPAYPTDTNGFNCGGFQRSEHLERERYQMEAPVEGVWNPSRNSGYDDDLGLAGRPHMHLNAVYEDNNRESNDLSDGEIREPGDYHRNYREVRDSSTFRDHEFERGGRSFSSERYGSGGDDYGSKRSAFKSSREGSWDKDYGHSRHGDEYESEQDEERRDRGWRKSQRRDKERRRSKDRDESPERGRRRDRSRSRGPDHRSRRSRSSSRGYTRERRDRSFEDLHRKERRYRDYSVSASATLVVKGLSQRTVEDDICKALVEWGPLRHVRVIKERNTGISRGFAFVDFPTVDAARRMMVDVGESGLVVDGRRLFFEYSSKPTGSSHADSGVGTLTVDWMCTVCGCVNFARRTSCFQCNEARTDDAPEADVSSVIPSASGRKGSEAGRTHVLVIRGLDEDAHEEILRYEFSKHAPIKDLRLVRDKFTHVSKGFAFVHFHSVEDATKALEATNGTMLDKSGHPLRVAYAKSTNAPGASSSAHSNNSLAAAAIEAAGFAQQYDPVGWAPKEYNPDEVQQQNDGAAAQSNSAPQAGFVWDEASGYYYDAVSGFYYDGHRGLYYDGNHGIWYTYNQDTQQYEPYVLKEAENASVNISAPAETHQKPAQKVSMTAASTVKSKDATTIRKAVISAPPSTIHVDQDSVSKLGGTTAKKEKGRKSKTKISGVSSIWNQKQEAVAQAATVQSAATLRAAPVIEGVKKNNNVAGNEILERSATLASSTLIAAPAPKKIQGVIHRKQTLARPSSDDETRYNTSATASVAVPMPRVEGIIRSKDGSTIGSGGGVSSVPKRFEGVIHSKDGPMLSMHSTGHQGKVGDFKPVENELKTADNAATLPAKFGYNEQMDVKIDSSSSLPGGRRRFTEAPAAPAQPVYRDRAAERRNLYGGL